MTYRLLLILFYTCFIALCTFLWKGYGVLGSCLIIFFSAPIWAGLASNRQPLTKEVLRFDIREFWSVGFWRILLLVLVHIIIILIIGRKTLIENLLWWYFVSAFSGYVFAYVKERRYEAYWLSLAVFPSMISVCLLLNFFLSTAPFIETYSYVVPTNHKVNKYDKDKFIIGPRIILKDHAYTEYPGIRAFFDRESIRGNKVTYTFENGILGFRVVKNIKFETVYK